VAKKNNIIEINGKRYDARSGALMSALDGHGLAERPAAQTQRPARKQVTHNAARQPAKPARRQSPQHSKTLMRHVVKKPSTPLPHIKARGHTDNLAKLDSADLVVQKPARSIDPARTKRAQRADKSQLITHFAPLSANNLPTFQLPRPSAASRALAARPPLKPVPVKSRPKPKTTADILDIALRQASSHEEPRPGKSRQHRKRRVGTLGASALAVLLLAFVGYQELPDIRLQMASASAGFNVGMPDSQPAGYSLNRLQYDQGVAALSFQSNSDDRQYSLTQKTTTWDSQALHDNFIIPNAGQYQAIKDGGITVYLYGDHDATWIKDGIWYMVQSHGSLSDRQLLDLADSI
jgi:hypothetical protein